MDGADGIILRARPLLGTFVEIAAAGAARSARAHDLEVAVEAAFAAVATVHRLMSFHDPASDVGRLNREAFGRAVPVHAWTHQVLATAADMFCRSAGMFDIAVAPVLQRMGLLPGAGLITPRVRALPRRESTLPPVGRGGGPVICSELAARPPTPSLPTAPRGEGGTRSTTVRQTRRDAARGEFWSYPNNASSAAAGAAAIELLPGHRVRFHEPCVIDLGGIAKGFAVDRAVDVLRRCGVPRGLVNAGGDLVAFGPGAHTVHIRDLRDPRRLMCRAQVSNQALASSASSFAPLPAGEPTRTAVIDPGSRTPVRTIFGATVRAPSCMVADALTKVVMIAGAGEAVAELLEHYGASALFVAALGDVRVTADWRDDGHLAA